MATKILVNKGSVNGLYPNCTKPLTNPLLKTCSMAPNIYMIVCYYGINPAVIIFLVMCARGGNLTRILSCILKPSPVEVRQFSQFPSHRRSRMRSIDIFCAIKQSIKQQLDITVTSSWARWRLKSPASRLFAQPFVQAQIKENIKCPRDWPLSSGFTPQKGQ